jgi:trimeric autotransporter adhesin
VTGVANESATMYLGKIGTQTKTVIAGIRGATTINNDAIAVMIDSAGQLGTMSSSRRFKEDIHDMADMSRRLFQLRPVTFRYKKAYGDGSKPIQYGLIAEEVADAFPELAVRNANGEVETVHYETLNVLLLNELKKQEQLIEKHQGHIDALEQRLNELVRRLATLEEGR